MENGRVSLKLKTPYWDIQCTNNSKILGHQMTPDTSLNISAGERIKRKLARIRLRITTVTDTKIRIKPRLISPHPIIGSIILYGLYSFNLQKPYYTNYKTTIPNVYAKSIMVYYNMIPISPELLTNKFVSTAYIQ